MSLLASIPRTYPASLLLNFDGANNSTTFTDSSIYNNTVTSYGSAIISTTQSKFGGSSGYFDGTGDYLSVPTNSVFAMGQEDFTVECWVYPTSWPTSDLGAIIENRSSASAGGFLLWLGNNQKWTFYTSSNSNTNQRTVSSVESATLNTWTHLAATRKNGTLYLFVNGFLVGSTAYAGAIDNLSPSNTRPILIGTAIDSPGSSRMFYGYIDGLRIVKGIDLYDQEQLSLLNIPPSQNAIIPPKLYNHIVMISTKSSGNITGNITTSSGYYTINWYDGTKITYATGDNFSKAAVGGNQHITIYPSLVNGTLSGFFENVNISNNSLISIRPFYSRFISSAGYNLPGYWTSTYFYSSYYSRGSRPTYRPGVYVPGTPYHLDVSSNLLDSSSLNQIYTDLLNGNGTIDVSDNTGGDSDNPSIATAKGYTVYGSLSPYTTLLLNLNSNYTDSSSQNISVSVLGGSPAFSTSIKKYGTASLSFNSGNIGNDSLVISDLSQVDYTIEFWIYRPTATNSYEGVINLSNGSGSTGINIHLYNSNDINFNNGQSGAAAGGTIGATQWYHVACVSRNNVKKLFIDGTLVSSATQATPAGPYKIKIGATYTLSQTSNAYIDDIRIIKGAAIYSSNFTPPTTQLAAYP